MEFDTEVYQTLDGERSGVKRLRRQVEAGVQDLLGRYDIPTKGGERRTLASRRTRRHAAAAAESSAGLRRGGHRCLSPWVTRR